METHVKVCLKSDWTLYCKEETYDSLKEAMKNKQLIEIENLFGSTETIDGEHIAAVFISTVQSREAYEKFSKLMDDEEKAFKKDNPDNPEWL